MTSGGPWRAPAQPTQSGQPAGHEPAAESAVEPESGSPSPEDTPRPMPREIHEAWVLWLAAAALALLGMMLNVATARFADLPAATRDTFRDAIEAAGTADMSVDAVFTMALVVGAFLAIVLAAVTVWLAFRLRAGKGWARTMLDIVAIFLVVDAVSVVIGVFGGVSMAGERGDVLSFIVFSLQILAGLCAATAVWRQHSAEGMAYTTPKDGARAGK